MGEKIRIILQEEKVLVPEGGEENTSDDLCAWKKDERM